MIPHLELPSKARPIFTPKRYKIFKGGRGSAKSETVGRYLLIEGAKKPERFLCAREFQNSITDSVHKLLSDLIAKYHLESFYHVQNNTIKGLNGTEFLFEGLRHNIQSIKSMQGITKVWVEEAQTVSKNSWDILIPTIREPGSEIIATYNPILETDETHQRFYINPPGELISRTEDLVETTLAIVVTMNYRDNPWFPEVLEQERLNLLQKDPEDYLNVYEGKCKQAVEGAIYSKQIVEAEMSTPQRITSVPYNPISLVSTYWDLGYSDATAIWFIQKVGFEYHAIDYVEDNLQDIKHYVRILNSKPYAYGDDYLPHDARAKQLGTGLSIEEQLRALGRKVKIVPMLSIVDGIAASRAMFPLTYFDREKCADGLNCLRHYQYGVNKETGQVTRDPLHNWASHGADAYRMFSVASKYIAQEHKEHKPKTVVRRGYGRI